MSTLGVMMSHARVSSSQKARSMICRSCSSMAPFSCAISVISRISPSVMVGAPSRWLRRTNQRVRASSGTTMGKRRRESQRMTGATASPKEMELAAANPLGVISPKISTRRVMMPVAYATPGLPKSCRARAVASEAAPILTMLLQTRMVARSFSGFAFNSASAWAPRRPSSWRVRTRASPREKSAISAPEKKPESTMRRARNSR